MAGIGWRLLKQLAQPLNPHKSETQRMLGFTTGGEIWVKSADKPEGLRGEGLDLVIFDECAWIKEDAWQEAIRPALSDRLGKAVFISTPAGRNWYYRLFMRSKEDPEWAAWHYPTASNPYISPQEIKAAEVELPDTIFRQEYLAEFIENEGSVFRNIRACLYDGEREHQAWHFTVCGVDWGKSNDYTCISVFCTECNAEVARDRFNKIDYSLQRQRLYSLVERWGIDVVLAESNAMGEPIIEQLQRDGLTVRAFQTTASSKPKLIENLVLCFEREEAMWQADPIWTNELEAYEVKLSQHTGRPTYGAPEGMHDDTVMARALAYWQAKQGRFTLA